MSDAKVSASRRLIRRGAGGRAPGGGGRCAVCALLLVLAVGLMPSARAQQTEEPAPAPSLDDWAVAPGYQLDIVGDGLVMPSSLAAVPDPGDGPDAPVLFIAELQGRIKELRRDGSIVEFVDVSTVGAQTTAFDGPSQQGLAGVCLDPADGYVFATFTDPDEGGVLRNHIMRWTVTAGSMAGAPSDGRELDPIVNREQAAPAHQIGNCQVVGRRLYVGVGDGGNPSAARRPDVLLGKVLCLAVDGGPCGDGPWAASPTDTGPSAYVWALGLRNPFALQEVGDRLYAAMNGIDIDSFLDIRRGGDYLWAGTDQQVAAAADQIFVPSISPVQLTYVPEDAPAVGPDQRGHFLFAAFGGDQGTSPGVVEVTPGKAPGERVLPSFLLEYRGASPNHTAGIALMPDGVYVAPLIPPAAGKAGLLRLRYAPEQAHPVTVAQRGSLLAAGNETVFDRIGCTGCHAINGVGGGIGPALDRFGIRWRLTQRLNASGYADQVAKVDQRTDAPYPSLRDERHAVLQAHGLNRTWVWLESYLQNPKFDNPDVAMPNLGLTAEQADEVRTALFRSVNLKPPGHHQSLWRRAYAKVMGARKVFGVGTAFGLAVGVLLTALVAWAIAARRRRGAAARG